MKTIEEAATDYWYDNVANGLTLDEVDETTFEDCFKAGADFAVANQWVSVEDRLPEEDGNTQILALTRKGAPGCYYKVECCWYNKGVFRNGQSVSIPVTHWMPIPEPKTEER